MRCIKCGKFGWAVKEHVCPPLFYFKHENWGDEPQKIHANNFFDAAQRFARIYNEDGDYALMDCEQEVTISDGKDEKIFVVSAEQDIHYVTFEKDK